MGGARLPASPPESRSRTFTTIDWLDWLAFHSPAFARLVDPEPRALIENGRVVRENLRRELITDEALLAHLREHGVTSIRDVERACLESEGRISVIRKPEEK